MFWKRWKRGKETVMRDNFILHRCMNPVKMKKKVYVFHSWHTRADKMIDIRIGIWFLLIIISYIFSFFPPKTGNSWLLLFASSLRLFLEVCTSNDPAEKCDVGKLRSGKKIIFLARADRIFPTYGPSATLNVVTATHHCSPPSSPILLSVVKLPNV